MLQKKSARRKKNSTTHPCKRGKGAVRLYAKLVNSRDKRVLRLCNRPPGDQLRPVPAQEGTAATESQLRLMRLFEPPLAAPVNYGLEKLPRSKTDLRPGAAPDHLKAVSRKHQLMVKIEGDGSWGQRKIPLGDVGNFSDLCVHSYQMKKKSVGEGQSVRGEFSDRKVLRKYHVQLRKLNEKQGAARGLRGRVGLYVNDASGR